MAGIDANRPVSRGIPAAALPEPHSLPVCESAYPTRAAAWYATFVLAMLYWLSVLDRFIVSLIAPLPAMRAAMADAERTQPAS